MDRPRILKQIVENPEGWDFIIIGGGATGLGVALDAVSRDYSVLLLEQSDFAKGTSSRSTKLVHGGVRYLAQGDLSLVYEALKERGLLLKNAPHLVQNQSFIIPIYSWRDRFKYTAGLKLYDIMAGKLSFGKSTFISRYETLRRLPTVVAEGLLGGVVYQDGQFDDARLAVSVAMTCADRGAQMLNYARVTSLLKDEDGKLNGVSFKDMETDKEYVVKSRIVINATGVFTDTIKRMDDPEAVGSITPSQGIHLVLDRSFLPGEDALMIPETDDGRVLFAVPWYDKLVLGTTDTPQQDTSLEPKALDEEIKFILKTAAKCLTRAPAYEDILSVFAGLRPLSAPQGSGHSTKEISRGHRVTISGSKLISITGGKWTTFRKMGEDTVSKAIDVAGLPPRKSTSSSVHIKGYTTDKLENGHLLAYGSCLEEIRQLIDENLVWGEPLHPAYTYLKAEVIWCTRFEMARTIEDFLSRRIRILLLDARAALEMAPVVATLMSKELKKNAAWKKEQVKNFSEIAKNYFFDIP